MGLFKKLIGDAKDYNKVANTVCNVKTILDKVEYEHDPEISDFLIAAWICRVGFIDVIEKNEWPMSNKLFIPINGHQTRMTLHEAYMMSIGRLSIKVGELYDDEVKNAVLNILDKGEYFYKIDRQIPKEKKEIFI